MKTYGRKKGKKVVRNFSRRDNGNTIKMNLVIVTVVVLLSVKWCNVRTLSVSWSGFICNALMKRNFLKSGIVKIVEVK